MKTAVIFASLVVIGGSLGVILASRDSKSAVSLGPSPIVAGTTTGSETTLPAPASLEVWFARGAELASVKRTHEATPRVATAAIEALLAGPTRAERAAGFDFRDPRGHPAAWNLDQGRSCDHRPHVGVPVRRRLPVDAGAARPVVYTLTQFPTVKKVSFRLDGTPVNVFSSEGIVLSKPVGRGDYKDLLPVIVVSHPTSGSRVTSPVTVRGARTSSRRT